MTNIPSPPPRLCIELVPSTSWFTNVRALVSAAEWTRLRQATYKAANHYCEICGGQGHTRHLECHERWHYDTLARVQTLTGLLALCPRCHEVKHFGLASVKGREVQATRWLMHVNGWTPEQTTAHIKAAFELWEQRSRGPWTVNIDWLHSPDEATKLTQLT